MGELSQTNPSLPPTATRPNNQPLIAPNGQGAKQPNPAAIMQPSCSHHAAIMQPSCSHHAAIMQPSNNQHLIAANAMRPNKPTLHCRRHANKPSRKPLNCRQRHSLQIIWHLPNRTSTGATRYTWRFIIADVMQSQPPQIASIQSPKPRTSKTLP